MFDSFKDYEIQKIYKVVDFAFQTTPQCKVRNFSNEYALQGKRKTDMLKFAYPLIIILLISFADSEISTAIYPLSYANSAFFSLGFETSFRSSICCGIGICGHPIFSIMRTNLKIPNQLHTV